eukprot:TRINITY_DN8184_c0_g1_i1.p1 TRINITY_DN8184_c0_g1~~TRINITY_DN8184_c0_g1_i1.p1  ORF type:complete len:785 (+),score=103.79 TRINITY_DN8184_c0_g1_i1:107-2461(+)
MSTGRSEQIRLKHTGWVPVVCTGPGSTNGQDPVTTKLLCPPDMTCEQLRWRVFEQVVPRVSLASDNMVLYVKETTIVADHVTVEELVRCFASEDGFVYVKVVNDDGLRPANPETGGVSSTSSKPGLDKYILTKLQRLLAKSPDQVPVRVVQPARNNWPDIDRKFLVPKTMTCQQFKEVIRKQIPGCMESLLWADVALFVGHDMLQQCVSMQEIYDKHKDNDLLLHINFDTLSWAWFDRPDTRSCDDSKHAPTADKPKSDDLQPVPLDPKATKTEGEAATGETASQSDEKRKLEETRHAQGCACDQIEASAPSSKHVRLSSDADCVVEGKVSDLLQRRLEDQTSKRLQLEQQVDEAQATQHQLRTQLEDSEAKVVGLSTHLEDSEAKVVALSTQLEDSEAKIVALRVHLEDSEAKVRELEESLSAGALQIAENISRVADLEDENEVLKRELALLKAAHVADPLASPTTPTSKLKVDPSWLYECQPGHWEACPSHVCASLTHAYASGESSVDFTCSGQPYRADFKGMCQVNLQTRSKRQIKFTFNLPPHWRNTDADMMNVLAQQPDFTRVARMMGWGDEQEFVYGFLNRCTFHHDLPLPVGGCQTSFRVSKAYRVENLQLWRQYCSALAQIKRTCATAPPIEKQFIGPLADFAPEAKQVLNPDVNEMFLLHGTGRQQAEEIVSNGFDFRHARTSGYYGRGTYFTSQACKAVQYGHGQAIIISRVIVGKPYYTPRVCKNLGLPPDNCNSIVALPGLMQGHSQGVQTHVEVVVFDRYVAYPEFVLFLN